MNSTIYKGLLSSFSPSGQRGKLSILLFHKVPRRADELTPNELTSSQFEGILDFLAENCNVLPLADATAALSKGKLPTRAVSLTFDDGYADWLETVSPALRARKLPATFFISTEQLRGAPLWHERIISAVRALPDHDVSLPFGFAKFRDLNDRQSRILLCAELQERLKYAPLWERLSAIEMLEAQAITKLSHPAQFDSAAVKELHGHGFEIGSHTIRHPILNECTLAEARDEIGGCREELESIIRSKVNFFAYPNGRPLRDYRGDHINLVRSCGYAAALATGGGAANCSSDPYQLPRFTPWGGSGLRIAVQLARNILASDIRVPPAIENPADESSSTEVKCLLIASTFPPIHGGSAVVYGNLCEKMPPGSIRVLAAKKNYLTDEVIAGWSEHDRQAKYPIDRINLLRPLMLPPPANTLVSLYRFIFQDLVLYGKILFAAYSITYKHNINVVCIGELVTGSWIGIALRKIFGCKLVIYVHGEEVTTATGGRLHGNKRQHYLQVADKVVAVSSFTCDALTQEMGLLPEAVALIQNGVDTDRFSPGGRDEQFLADKGLVGKKIVLTVGRLVPRKGIDMTIRAIKQLHDIPDLKYLIVGEGEYRSELEKIITDEKLEDRVNLVGKVSDPELLNYLRTCNVFVMANRTMPDGDTEGFGLVFREANACGKPVIGGRAGGAVEAVIDGETGFLVDGTDPDEIAQKIRIFLENSQLAEAMGQAGLKLAGENSTKSVSAKFLKICERLLENGRRAT